MKQNELHLYQGSRWALYHGTSTIRLQSILNESRLRRAGSGDEKISLTTERSVAEYFACNAAHADRDKRNRVQGGENSTGVVLILDGEGRLALNYNLNPFSDAVWGEGECDWENEIECWDDIEPLDEVLLAIDHVAPDRYQQFIEHGPACLQVRHSADKAGGRARGVCVEKTGAA